jgi:hypothetical protein
MIRKKTLKPSGSPLAPLRSAPKCQSMLFSGSAAGIRSAAFHPAGAARLNASIAQGLPDGDDLRCTVYFRDMIRHDPKLFLLFTGQ